MTMQFSRRHIVYMAALWLCLISLAYWVGYSTLDLSLTKGHLMAGDGFFYYEYLTSFVAGTPLDFCAIRQQLSTEGLPYLWDSAMLAPTQTGKCATPFAFGWSLLVSPFFILAHTIATALNTVQPTRLDGYGFLHESLTVYGAVVYGFLSIIFMYRICRFWLDRFQAATIAFGVFAASNAIYYSVVQPAMSHVAGMFCISGTLYFWLRFVFEQRRKDIYICAVFICLSGFVRPQLLTLGGLILLDAAFIRKDMKAALAVFAALALSTLVTMAIWFVIFGKLLLVPQGDAYLSAFTPHPVSTLFSLHHGLMLWHPVYLLCTIGLIVYARHHLGLAVAGILILNVFVQLYINSIPTDWWGGNSFGSRRFVDILPLFLIGGIFLLKRLPKPVVTGLFVVLIAWNFLFIVQYRFGFIPRGETITARQLLIEKFQILQLERKY